MKIDLFMFGNELAFSLRKKDIQTESDKKAICQMINAICHVHCFEYMMENSELDKLIASCESAKVGFTVRYIDKEPSLTLLKIRTPRGRRKALESKEPKPKQHQ